MAATRHHLDALRRPAGALGAPAAPLPLAATRAALGPGLGLLGARGGLGSATPVTADKGCGKAEAAQGGWRREPLGEAGSNIDGLLAQLRVERDSWAGMRQLLAEVD